MFSSNYFFCWSHRRVNIWLAYAARPKSPVASPPQCPNKFSTNGCALAVGRRGFCCFPFFAFPAVACINLVIFLVANLPITSDRICPVYRPDQTRPAPAPASTSASVPPHSVSFSILSQFFSFSQWNFPLACLPENLWQQQLHPPPPGKYDGEENNNIFSVLPKTLLLRSRLRRVGWQYEWKLRTHWKGRRGERRGEKVGGGVIVYDFLRVYLFSFHCCCLGFCFWIWMHMGVFIQVWPRCQFIHSECGQNFRKLFIIIHLKKKLKTNDIVKTNTKFILHLFFIFFVMLRAELPRQSHKKDTRWSGACGFQARQLWARNLKTSSTFLDRAPTKNKKKTKKWGEKQYKKNKTKKRQQ